MRGVSTEACSLKVHLSRGYVHPNGTSRTLAPQWTEVQTSVSGFAPYVRRSVLGDIIQLHANRLHAQTDNYGVFS